MLILKPNCECCDTDLPPESQDAMICSYECTFCRTCVEDVLSNVCPNCGGGFVARPIRPKTERRPGVCLDRHPPPNASRWRCSRSVNAAARSPRGRAAGNIAFNS